MRHVQSGPDEAVDEALLDEAPMPLVHEPLVARTKDGALANVTATRLDLDSEEPVGLSPQEEDVNLLRMPKRERRIETSERQLAQDEILAGKRDVVLE